LRNLLSNAVRYTTAGRVLVAVRTAGREQAAIEVWDTGPGIPEDLRDLVFQEFYRAETVDSKNGGGLGLGLAIVRRLCALMDHPLELRSRAGLGSMFRVRVPIAEASVAEPASEYPETFAASGARVWVIDDDTSVCASMAALLRAWGHQVTTGASSEEMLANLDRDPRAPHAIICDWRLRNENGAAAIRRLQAMFPAAIPAALISGDTDPERLREAAVLGVPLLHKPLGKAALRALIGNLVRQRQDA
jgi:CheY-like chemotaxis protein